VTSRAFIKAKMSEDPEGSGEATLDAFTFLMAVSELNFNRVCKPLVFEPGGR
jgi:hypothetical protein